LFQKSGAEISASSSDSSRVSRASSKTPPDHGGAVFEVGKQSSLIVE
jgi:hypothetical protein